MTGDPAMFERLWSTILKSGHVYRDTSKVLRFSGVPSENRDGSIEIALDETWDVRLNQVGRGALGDLAKFLMGSLGARIDKDDLWTELLREVGRVLLPGSDLPASFQSLTERLARYTSAAVVAVPLGGIYSSLSGPKALGKSSSIGHVSREMEMEIAGLARRVDLGGFQFTDVWWTEDFIAAETDGQFAVELMEREAEEGLWQPLVLAMAVDQVGALASFSGILLAEAFLGAVIALSPESDSRTISPWVLGKSTISGSPGEAALAEDGTFPVLPLQVDARQGREYRSDVEFGNGRVVNMDLAYLLEDPVTRLVLTRVLGSNERTVDPSSKIASACRLAFAAYSAQIDVSITLYCRAIQMFGKSISESDPIDQYMKGRVALEDLFFLRREMREEVGGLLRTASSRG